MPEHRRKLRLSGSKKYDDARRLKDKLPGQRARDELGRPHAMITVGGLRDQFLNVLAVRVRPNTFAIQKMVLEAHFRPYFGDKKAEKITTALLLSHRAHREQEQAQPATINRELSLLRNCMRTCANATPALIPATCIPRFPITNEDVYARQVSRGRQVRSPGCRTAALPGSDRHRGV